MNPKFWQMVWILPAGLLLFASCLHNNEASRQPTLTSKPLTSIPMSEHWNVKSVSDGDTITVTNGRENRKVRFCGVDTPEKKQEGGPEATAFVQKAIANSNNKVAVAFIEKDQYGRWVGEVFINAGSDNEALLNAELILEGHAWPYKRYWNNCPNRLPLELAEEMANKSGKGLWLQPGAIAPWEWRRRN